MSAFFNYLIQRGDTLNNISSSSGISTDELRRNNNIGNGNIIVQGTQLRIPVVTYQIRSGDDFSKLADSVKPFKSGNVEFVNPGVSSRSLQIGQWVLFPGSTRPGGTRSML